MTRESQAFIVWSDDADHPETEVIASSALGALTMMLAQLIDDGVYSDFIDVLMPGPIEETWRVRRPNGTEFAAVVQSNFGLFTLNPATGAENTPWANDAERAA